MAVNLWESPSQNAFQTTLNGSIDNAVTTISLNSATNLVAPGVLVIDRQDGSGNDTPTTREYITFTGISSNDITGVTRGVAGSTAQAHNSGALVEATFSVTHWIDIVDYLEVEHVTASGQHQTIEQVHTLGVLSLASIANAELEQMALTSLASIENLSVVTLTAPIPKTIQWTDSKALVTVTTSEATQYPFVRITRNMTLTDTWVGVQSAPSTAALQWDVNWASGPTGNWQTIFSVVPQVDIGEFSTDTSSQPGTLDLTSLASGILLRPELLSPGGSGFLTAQLIGEERP